MATNNYRGNNYGLDTMLAIKDKRFFSFKQADIRYLTTVRYVDGSDAEWGNINLVNTEFVNLRKAGEALGHNGKGWVILPHHICLSYCENMMDALRDKFGAAKTFYNFRENRIEFQFFPKDKNDVHLLVTFKPGHPDEEHLVQAEPIVRTRSVAKGF